MIVESFLLALAISFDAFLTGFAYGSDKIKIPFKSNLVINLICSSTLAFSLVCGSFITAYLPTSFTKIVSFFILFSIGLIKLFNSFIKEKIVKQRINKEIQLKFSNLNLILHVYADPKVADVNNSRHLSIKEAISLAIAVSLDGLFVGLSYGFNKSNILLALLFTFTLGFLGIIFGSNLGKTLIKTTNKDYSFISGLLLVFLAVSKLL